MSKFWGIITKVSTITSKSISVADAKEAVENLDSNDDGQLSLFDLVMLLIDKVAK